MRKKIERSLCRSASLLAVALAVATGVTGCGKAVEGYEVQGSTNERSLVSDEPFADRYSTMEYAKDEEVEGSRTQYDESEYASAGETGPAPEEEEGRKWRTILEDVSLFSSPQEGKVLIVVPKGSKVDVLTKKKDGWYKIRYRGTVGYIKSGYFVEDWEEEQEERRVREEAEAKRKAEEAAKKKAEEEAKKKAEEDAARKAREEERARAMANGEVTRRMAETVNMRDPDDPDILYGIVPTGSYVTVLADLGDGWYLVDYDGMEGMIKGGYFTEEDP